MPSDALGSLEIYMKGERKLEFTEYAKGLFPFISFGKKEAPYFVELIGNYIKDSAMDSCALLRRKPDTQYRYINGSPIQAKDAQYLYDHRDTDKFSQWILNRMDESESFDSVCDWLKENGMPGNYPENECEELLTKIILSICGASKAQKRPSSQFEESLDLIKDISAMISALPKPTKVPVPSVATSNEQAYIGELLKAYGDAEGIANFTETELQTHEEYQEDLDDRRIDYYAAVSVERGVMELDADNLSNQFDVLKEETLDSVKDTARKSYPNGYEKMLSVMEQASTLTFENYLLSKSPYWISSKIKKGVCHHLVNDGKLKWVKKKK